tara:strand:- start:5836 stop:6093 length:258 start_codon:yes stop_codon:yes gene_type:complete
MKGNILTYALIAVGAYIVYNRFIKKGGTSAQPVMTTRPAQISDAQLEREIKDDSIVEAAMEEMGSEGAAVAEPTSGADGWDSNAV